MSPRVAKSLPIVKPILLTLRRDPFDDPAWLFEPKYDGYRGLLYVTGQGCYFRSLPLVRYEGALAVRS